ncbi:hypothetical protein EVAR_40263_1 [Eumeta japonica]|uniref:Uncharacterized protein n=1 Tax=Eumeta variegata TaxID=151549 RepID=A0A4C1Y362_EUMVA|nr:hypothetical protein EVAR_40263_1 [Eumeta japonica]
MSTKPSFFRLQYLDISSASTGSAKKKCSNCSDCRRYLLVKSNPSCLACKLQEMITNMNDSVKKKGMKVNVSKAAPASLTVETTNTTEGAQMTAATAVEEAQLLSPVADEQESWTSPHSGVSSSSDSEYVAEESSADISSPAVTPPQIAHHLT